MPGSFTNTTENAILNLLLGSGANSLSPATHYIALFTAIANGETASATEVTGGSYSRVAYTNSGANWPVTSTGIKANANAITFATATANWGTVVGVGIYDAATGGTLVAYSTVTAQDVPSGVTATIQAGALTVSLD